MFTSWFVVALHHSTRAFISHSMFSRPQVHEHMINYAHDTTITVKSLMRLKYLADCCYLFIPGSLELNITLGQLCHSCTIVILLHVLVTTLVFFGGGGRGEGEIAW